MAEDGSYGAARAVVDSGDLAAAAAFVESMASWPAKRWRAFDKAGRRDWTYYLSYRGVRPLIGAAQMTSLLGLVVLTTHPNGYAREEAVAALAPRDEPAVLATLALRCADPVPQVRDRARAAVAERLRAYDPAVLAAADVALGVAGQKHGGWLSDALGEALATAPPAFRDAALAAPAPMARRLAYDVLGASLPFDRLVAVARSDGDLVVRVRAATTAVAAARATGDAEALRPLLRSGTAYVRAAVVHELATAGSLGPAYAALGDRSMAVRAVAQAAVRRAGEDPAAWYRAAPLSAATVAGLGECGTAADAPLVRPGLDDPRPAVRAAAVTALRRLAAVDASLAPMLGDESPAVTRAASMALRNVPGVDAVALLVPERPPHVRLAAFRLLRTRDALTRLRTDLALVPDPDLGAYALRDLHQWMRQEAATAYVSVGDDPSWEASLARAAAVLPEGMVRSLRFLLGVR